MIRLMRALDGWFEHHGLHLATLSVASSESADEC
jgi:hypothetical protein